jgi:MFS family permease
MGFLAVVLQTLGLGLGFVYMSMGIFVGPAVAPAAMAILMEKASGTWCTIGAIMGLIGGVITWLVCAYGLYGEITLDSLGGDYPFLWSNVVSICFSGFVAISGSLLFPDSKFKWEYLAAQLPLVDDMPPVIEKGRTAKELDDYLKKSYWRSVFWANFLFFFLCLLLPVGLFLSGLVFGYASFGIWIAVFMTWCFLGGLTVIILPIIDFKNDLAKAAARKGQATEVKKNVALVESAPRPVVPMNQINL